MRDQYSPRDLIFDRIKQIYDKELLGPSLKQMSETKRLADAQDHWRRLQAQYE